MLKSHLRDERGVGMLIELVLVAAVLGLVGVALYEANHHSTKTASVEVQKSATKATVADTAAEAAATAVTDDATSDITISNESDNSSDIYAAVDTDAANLGGAFDDNSF